MNMFTKEPVPNGQKEGKLEGGKQKCLPPSFYLNKKRKINPKGMKFYEQKNS